MHFAILTLQFKDTTVPLTSNYMLVSIWFYLQFYRISTNLVIYNFIEFCGKKEPIFVK